MSLIYWLNRLFTVVLLAIIFLRPLSRDCESHSIELPYVYALEYRLTPAIDGFTRFAFWRQWVCTAKAAREEFLNGTTNYEDTSHVEGRMRVHILHHSICFLLELLLTYWY